MKHAGKIAVIAAGIGLASLGLIGTSMVRAETTTNTSTTTTATTMADRHQAHFADLAEQLGVTTDQLQTEMDSGKEFYQIAAAHGVTYAELKASRETDMKARLADMVKVGFLTQAEADSQLKLYQERADEGLFLGGPMGGGKHIRGHGFGM
ncbi:MAG: hypothetical protein HY975_04465 [Candidatus Kerfeldbacteria bacterium]|nr:hypothetical protein [Candidatus Kerfeldbacteria bacterium]